MVAVVSMRANPPGSTSESVKSWADWPWMMLPVWVFTCPDLLVTVTVTVVGP